MSTGERSMIACKHCPVVIPHPTSHILIPTIQCSLIQCPRCWSSHAYVCLNKIIFSWTWLTICSVGCVHLVSLVFAVVVVDVVAVVVVVVFAVLVCFGLDTSCHLSLCSCLLFHSPFLLFSFPFFPLPPPFSYSFLSSSFHLPPSPLPLLPLPPLLSYLLSFLFFPSCCIPCLPFPTTPGHSLLLSTRHFSFSLSFLSFFFILPPLLALPSTLLPPHSFRVSLPPLPHSTSTLTSTHNNNNNHKKTKNNPHSQQNNKTTKQPNGNRDRNNQPHFRVR